MDELQDLIKGESVEDADIIAALDPDDMHCLINTTQLYAYFRPSHTCAVMTDRDVGRKAVVSRKSVAENQRFLSTKFDWIQISDLSGAYRHLSYRCLLRTDCLLFRSPGSHRRRTCQELEARNCHQRSRSRRNGITFKSKLKEMTSLRPS